VTWISTLVSLVAMLVKGCWDGDAPTIGTAVLGIIAAVQHPPWKVEA